MHLNSSYNMYRWNKKEDIFEECAAAFAHFTLFYVVHSPTGQRQNKSQIFKKTNQFWTTLYAIIDQINHLKTQWWSHACLYNIPLSRPSVQFNRSSIGRLAISKSFCTVITHHLFLSLSLSHTESNPYFSFQQSIHFFCSCGHVVSTVSLRHTRSCLYPHRLWVNTYAASPPVYFFSFLHLSKSLCWRNQIITNAVWLQQNYYLIMTFLGIKKKKNDLSLSEKVTVALTLTWPQIRWLVVAVVIEIQFHFT